MDPVMFEEIQESLKQAIEYSQGKRTLKTYTIEIPSPPEYVPEEIIEIRKKLNFSQAIFAEFCNVSKKTVQAWEQGIRNPTGAALRLLQLIKINPELFFKQIKA